MPNLLVFADDAARFAAVSYQSGAVDQSDYDFSSYGPGKSYMQVDHRRRPNGFANNWNQLNSENYAFFGGVPQISFSSARMQRGEVLPTLANNTVGLATFPGLSAVMSPIARLFLPAMIGSAGTAAAASMLAILPAYGLGKAAAGAVRYFNRFGYQQRHIEMGGDYSDTETAYALRTRAVSDMSSAMSYPRRWLGNEASFMR